MPDGSRSQSPAPQIDIAQDFAELLTGSREGILRLRFIHDSKPSEHPPAEREGTVSELWNEIRERQQQGYGVFYFINECRSGAGSGKGGCATDADMHDTCRAVATDHDRGLPDEWEWHCHPRVIVRTSRVLIDGKEVQKGQALWPVKGLAKADFKQAQRRLAAHYRTDPAISNPSRVLRLPGTLHLKGNPQLVTFTDCTERWLVDGRPPDPVQGLPDLPEGTKNPPAQGAPVSTEHLRMLLSYLDPDTPYAPWRDIVAAIRATPLTNDGDESERRRIAHEFSEGKLDRQARYSDSPPARYSGAEAVDRVFDTMPPKPDGVGYGTIFHAAELAGYDGPPAHTAASAAETFGPFLDKTTENISRQDRQIPFLMTEQDLFALPDPEELVAGFIMCGENVCLFGQPKVGKTFVALDLALSIAANLPVFGRLPVRKTGPVVYLSGEGHAGMKRRLKSWRQQRAVPAESRLPFFYRAEVPSTSAGIEECQKYVDGIRGDLGRDPVLVVIDTMARSMAGLNENDAGDVGRYLALTERLRADLQCPVLTLAHSGKDETKGIRGSNASTAGFDAVWDAEMNDANKTVKIESKWLKDAEELGPFCFRLKPVNVEGMINGKGAVLEYVPLEEFRKTTSEDDARNARTRIFDALQKLGAYGIARGRTSRELAEFLAGEPPRPSDNDRYQEWETAVAKEQEHLDNGARERRGGKGRKATRALFAGYSERRTRPGGGKLMRLWFLPGRDVVDGPTAEMSNKVA